MDLQSTLQSIQRDLIYLNVEISLIIGSVILLIYGSLKLKSIGVKIIYFLTLILSIYLLEINHVNLFNGHVVADSTTYFFKFLFLLVSLSVLLFNRRNHTTEFYFLVFAVLVGSIFMLQSYNFVLIYLSIELTSYASYSLTALKLNQKGSEAAFKYLLFGGVSSAVMLYGISLLYGSGGSLMLGALEMNFYGKMGLFLFLGGLLFKTSIVPFHFWTPGTYQAAPTDAVLLFSILPKLAGFVMISNLLKSVGMIEPVNILLIVLSMITILWGTFSAIPQKNVKRLISYGAIAHSGFILPFVVINSPEALSGFWFYALVYSIMNISIFYVIDRMEMQVGDNVRLIDLDGMGKKNGLVGAGIVIVVVALVGLPPTVGFTAKLLLFSNVWLQYDAGGNPIWFALLLIGILSSVVSLFFYLKIPYHFFFKKSETQTFEFGRFGTVIATILAVSLLILFIEGNIFDNFDMMSQSIDHQENE